MASSSPSLQGRTPTPGPGNASARGDIAKASERFGGTLSWMRFPPALEKQFLHDIAPARLRYFLISGVISLIVFNGFLLVDYLMARDVFWLAFKIRLLWFSPFAAATLIAFWWWRDQVLERMSPLVIEYVVLVSGVLAAACLSYILASSRVPTSQYYHAGLMVVIMYGNLVQRLRFWYAVTFSLAVYAMNIGGIMMVPAFNPRLVAPLVALVSATIIFTLMANYALERDERRQYLLAQRRKHVLHDLEDVQRRLQWLSRMDVLTGLYNRRHFQQYFAQVWARAQHGNEPLAIVMVDVDHFKRYNDHHGHPAGDQCLTRVAQSMQESLRQPGDLVARFGGEEFIAVLPQADAGSALKAADRIRQGIEEMQLPHEAGLTGAVVTVSVGVASCTPRADLREQDLIAAADAALYQAKQSGRNTVVSSQL